MPAPAKTNITLDEDAVVPEPPLSPTCISPDMVDDKLAHYVAIFGSRWALIKVHMQAQFSIAFPARYLEQRWQKLQDARKALNTLQPSSTTPLSALTPVRSPFTSMDAVEHPVAPIGIQERIPLQALPKAKRWREENITSPTQPVRPQPPSSPRTLPSALPKGLKQGLCPTFLLAPGSSLAAPDSVRRQLKAVYLASLLSERNTENQRSANGSTMPIATPKAEADDIDRTVIVDISAAPKSRAQLTVVEEIPKDSNEASLFASDEEKHQIVALLARELSSLRHKGAGVRSVDAAPPRAGKAFAKNEAVAARNGNNGDSKSGGGLKSRRSLYTSQSLLTAQGSGVEGYGADGALATLTLTPTVANEHRWPCCLR